jgi:hypothetical protein
VTGVDGMGEKPHGFKRGGLTLLTHYVLDVFRQSGIVTVTEDGVVPVDADGESVELKVVFDNVLVILHLQIINAILGVSSRIDRAKLGAEKTDKGRSIVHPSGYFIGIQNCRFKVFQGHTTEIRQSEGHLVFVIGVRRVVAEVEIT